VGVYYAARDARGHPWCLSRTVRCRSAQSGAVPAPLLVLVVAASCEVGSLSSCSSFDAILLLQLCVCVCACVRACACVCVRACVRACLLFICSDVILTQLRIPLSASSLRNFTQPESPTLCAYGRRMKPGANASSFIPASCITPLCALGQHALGVLSHYAQVLLLPRTACRTRMHTRMLAHTPESRTQHTRAPYCSSLFVCSTCPRHHRVQWWW
jgi:hypothetical protein